MTYAHELIVPIALLRGSTLRPCAATPLAPQRPAPSAATAAPVQHTLRESVARMHLQVTAPQLFGYFESSCWWRTPGRACLQHTPTVHYKVKSIVKVGTTCAVLYLHVVISVLVLPQQVKSINYSPSCSFQSHFNLIGSMQQPTWLTLSSSSAHRVALSANCLSLAPDSVSVWNSALFSLPLSDRRVLSAH